MTVPVFCSKCGKQLLVAKGKGKRRMNHDDGAHIASTYNVCGACKAK